ncbi:outer membrane protein assembly factor BamB family protein [Catalinimonas niigatensis]|uniref:outer membrane protein assembly factor BamB family protein n=1 Tax=Catalinimonas niigatensis TaxID=1397264 RepID=UPI0026670649|nr:PQQ-binding-like beta-propeller repeat protein [Catalinimonas niigatensis]WPP51604.1 PQQ-binding-like beta-propeller repeat protein [Catalinimonas niigatensis]
MQLTYYLPLGLAGVMLLSSCTQEKSDFSREEQANYTEWSSYLGDPGRSHYSLLNQINKKNVSTLEVAWTYHAGQQGKGGANYIQANPLIVNDILYGVSPGLKVFAVNAANGTKIWEFNPYEGTDRGSFTRGLVFWEDDEDQRILFSADQYLYALDATNGKLISDFGKKGRIDLTEGLGREVKSLDYRYHTAGAVYKDLIIMGALNSERLPAAPGHIRAFNIRTGKQEWIFNTIPQPGEFGYDTWEDQTAYQSIGGANNWAGMTVDEEREIVFVPTGSAAFDFYGGNRKGNNLFANSLLALDANTGKRIWHFQTVHHDLWDRDLPAPPNLVTVEREGKKVDAIAQITKSGHIYVLDRDTGEPLFPVEEKHYPESDLVGEQTWPTQPLPTSPPPFARQQLTEADINPYSKDKDSLLAVLKRSRSNGQFVPPSKEGTIIFPGFDGGGEWGGAGYDPVSNVLYVNANEMPWILTMIETQEANPDDMLALGKSMYQTNCMGCHGADLQGSNFHGNAPELVHVKQRLKHDEITQIVKEGRGSMPSFAFLQDTQIDAIAAFLLGKAGKMKVRKASTTLVQQETGNLRYNHTGYNRFVDSEGYPAVEPPWGTLNAIDLDEGKILWSVPLGEYEELTARGVPKTGTENYGGPVVTAGGLIFIAATTDEYIRAFDKDTGEELWKYKLPAAGMATAATYEVDGQQYLVIAAGGGKTTDKRSDAYVAFALPENNE